MALDFPSSPTVGQTFTVSGATWTWDGVKWTASTGRTGVTDGSDAAAGQIGEYVTAVRSSGLTLVTATPANVTSIALTAGDWDVRGRLGFTTTGSTITALLGGTGTVSATLPTDYGNHANVGTSPAFAVPTVRISTAAPVTAYLVGQSNFTATAPTVIGSISARRVR